MATTTPANVFPKGIKPFAERKHPKVICMFDVDGTLTPARLQGSKEMLDSLKKLREYTATAFVGGSDFKKIEWQLEILNEKIVDNWDYCFAENGLTAWKLGNELESASFIKYVGEEEYKKMVNFILRYLSEVDVPVKRGTFIEFRNGMINVSPVGRNASTQERNDFEKFDSVSSLHLKIVIIADEKEHKIRATMIAALKEKFGHLGLTYSIGGQISFDVFPTGWDKTFSLNHIQDEGFEEIHFFGDKTYMGGNDYEIFEDKRTIGHTVTSPEDTAKLLDELFFSKA